VISFIKARNIIHVRCTDQSPIESVGPRVIRTLDRGRATARVLLKSRPAGTAHIVKPVNLSSLITQNDHRFIRDLRDKIITSFGNLTLMPDQYPLFGKDLFLFLLENVRRN